VTPKEYQERFKNLSTQIAQDKLKANFEFLA